MDVHNRCGLCTSRMRRSAPRSTRGKRILFVHTRCILEKGLLKRRKPDMYRIAAQTVLMGILCLAAPSAIQDTKVTPLMTQSLAGVTGKEAVMLTVEYAPGASSSKHRHNANTFVYVLEGSIVMQV